MLAMAVIILIFLLTVGTIPSWPHSRNWGYFPSWSLGMILILAVLFVLLRPF